MDTRADDDSSYGKSTFQGLIEGCPKNQSPPVVKTEDDMNKIVTYLGNSIS